MDKYVILPWEYLGVITFGLGISDTEEINLTIYIIKLFVTLSASGFTQKQNIKIISWLL